MNLPYGISNFAQIRQDRYFYVDKTPFIPRLEDPARGRHYVLFLRPRRFGKTTLLSMLEHYYDILHADRFDALFSGLWIADHPTPEKSSYLILRLELTGMATDAGVDQLRAEFTARLLHELDAFCARYAKLLPELGPAFRAGATVKEPAVLMHLLFTLLRQTPYRLYILIDEYDSFGNDIIARGRHELFYTIVRASGFVRDFFRTLKEGTATGPVRRLLMTGVSPIMLGEMTSGFNILSNASRDEDLHELCGFTPEDVAALLDRTIAGQPFALLREQVLADLRRYYDGYVFSPRATGHVYNPDMVLYFMKGLTPPAQYPEEILDFNLRTDVARLRSLVFDESGRPRPDPIAQLRALFAEGQLVAYLHDTFLLEQAHDEQYFASYLYYLGLLTIAGRERSRLLLRMPNYAIEQLHGELLSFILREAADVRLSTERVRAAVEAMAYNGDTAPFLQLLHEEVIAKVSNRDLMNLDEKALKLLILGYLSLSPLFYPFSEFEMRQGYGDLCLVLNRQFPDASYSFLIELKYVKAAAGKRAAPKKGARAAKAAAAGVPKAVEQAMAEAEQQLGRYRAEPRLHGLGGPGGWCEVAVVFVGAEAVYARAPGEKTRQVVQRG